MAGNTQTATGDEVTVVFTIPKSCAQAMVLALTAALQGGGKKKKKGKGKKGKSKTA